MARTSDRGGRARRAVTTSARSSIPRDRIDLVGRDCRGVPAAGRASRARSSSTPPSRTTAPKRRLRTSDSTASSRSSASSEISVSPSRVSRNDARSDDLHLGEEPRRGSAPITSSSGTSRPRVPIATNRSSPSGHLDAREALLAGLRVADEQPEAQREARRCTGTAGRGRPRAASARGRSAAEHAARARRARLSVASSTVPTRMPFAASAGQSSSRQSARLLRRQVDTRSPDLHERLLRRAAVAASGRRARRRPGRAARPRAP